MKYGYCAVGRIVAVGDECKLAVGTRVFSFQPHASAFIADEGQCMVIPDGVSYEDAVLLPSMETAVSFVQDSGVVFGDRVCVMGLGVIGLLVTALLSVGDFVDVMTVDPAPARRAAARDVVPKRAGKVIGTSDGKEAAAGSLTDFDVVIEASGNGRALQFALDRVRFGGKVLVGSLYGTAPVPLRLGTAIHRSHAHVVFSQVSNVSAILSSRWSKQRRMAFVWQQLRALRPSAWLISHRVPLHDAPATYARLLTTPNDFLQVILLHDPLHLAPLSTPIAAAPSRSKL